MIRLIRFHQKGGEEMVSFGSFTMEGDSPIYSQIIRYVKRGIVAGAVRDGEEMPSRRVLSSLLGVNPNTIQKAYRMLEEEGLLQSHPGAKSYISASPGQVEAVRRQLLEREAGRGVAAMRQMGLSRREALELVDRMWSMEEEKG